MENSFTDDISIPDLTFPMIEYGRNETPWDLKSFLYYGGARISRKFVYKFLKESQLGKPCLERISLVVKLHEDLTFHIVNGGSRFSIENRIFSIRCFIQWVDEQELSLSIESVENLFIYWTEFLLSKNRAGDGLSAGTMYERVMMVSSMLDHILQRKSSLIKSTRIRKPCKKNRININQIQKHSLQSNISFGHFLVDICESLTQEAIFGPVPICIKFRDGLIYKHWGRFFKRKDGFIPTIISMETSLDNQHIFRTHSSLINLRIEAELLIFIAQTGMNLQQAYLLKVEQFHFSSYMDGYQVRSFKNRRQGEVLFEIFTNYRSWLKNYITWRKNIFLNDADELMFPIIRRLGRNMSHAPQFTATYQLCKELNRIMIRPRALRRVRINWLLRESADPNFVAEMTQHTTEVLFHEYLDPNPQIAIQEISRFHKQMEEASFAAPAPGVCVSTIPTPISYDIPISPDCISAAGCLFCLNHRDIESQDHIWSISSFKYLKSLELSRYRLSKEHTFAPIRNPVLLTIERLTEKLIFIGNSSQQLKMWVEEAKERINEGHYHPTWDGYIQLIEISERAK